ncbi:mechanosensitive ion channel family protein [Methanogenium marinum]|uniref:Mechanosensitive ion channel family protein n=1 Tax=Methanogenium marinum TaxID=348610 RepID=A0A9Q4KP63_9EURY|nr:mechanosensitive ion channel domain-containing protein [Methanogenium marinum]MDE4907655.1 mechanosensitive ion channel family protein [Methanogenium marinum]
MAEINVTSATESSLIPSIVPDLDAVISVVLILVVAYLIVKVADILLRKISEKAGRYRITVTMVIPLLKIIVYVSAVYFILKVFFDPGLTELALFSGLFGAAIGFGLKDIFADIVGGVVIAFERPYQIGDKIEVSGTYGEVTDIGLRATRVVTPDDSVVSIPNYAIFQEPTASQNAGKTEMMVIIDIYIDPRSDAGTAMSILKDALITSKYVYISPKRPYTVLLQDYPFYRRIRGKAYVNDLRSEFEFGSEVTRRAWVELTRQGILPPPPAHVPGEVTEK